MADENKPKPTSTDTPQQKDGNPRPFPSFPRRKKGKPATIYALLVGINDYQGSVTKLGGCINDVNLVANYLRQQFGEDPTEKIIKSRESVKTFEKHGRLRLRILTNAEATYANVIKYFDEDLIGSDATANDTFWFHFSGHGTERFTAEAFYKPKDANHEALPSLEPSGKDQSLVCFNPGGTQDNIFLADKELAAMIDTLFQAPTPAEGTQPHIVVSLDCCHSGSGTRDFMEPPGFKSRHFDFLRGATEPEPIGPEGMDHGEIRGDGLVANSSRRSLDSYYKGYYSAHKDDQSQLRRPEANHVLLSACTNVEKAGDLPGGGVFSSSLVETLKRASTSEVGTINYADLYKQTRALARSKRNAQSPQFEPIAGFNPHTAFLEGWGLGNSDEYEVVPQNDKWYIRCGAIHGLPTNINTDELPEGSPKETIVKVYKKSGKEFLGHALVKKVGVQESQLELLKDLQGKLEAIKATSAKKDDLAKEPYVAEIFQLADTPFYVHLDGSEAATQMLRDSWSKALHEQDRDLNKLNILIAETAAEIKAATTRVVINEDGYQIWEIQQDRSWMEQPLAASATVEESSIVQLMKGHLRKIARWNRLLALTNGSSRIKNDYELEFATMDYAQWEASGKIDTWNAGAFFEHAEKHDGPNVRVVVPQGAFITSEHQDDSTLDRAVDNDSILFGVRLHSKKDNLFYYLYDFKSNAAIEFVAEQKLEQKTDAEGIALIAPLDFYLEDHETQGITRIKLLVTQKPLRDTDLLTQSGLDADKAFGGGRRAVTTDGWQAETITLTIVRQQDSIKKDEVASVADGNVTIMPHPSVSADLSVTATREQEEVRGMRVDPFRQMQDMGIDLVNFRKERGLGKQNVLELDNLVVAAPDKLAADPLQIRLNESMAEDETIVPITFDGEFLRVIGDAEQVGDQVQVNIRSLPEEKKNFNEEGNFIPNPLGNGENERSLIKGLKLAFLKWRAGSIEDEQEQAEKLAAVNQLCWVSYLEDNTIERRPENVAAKVKLANNILLCVHGIIGDTESIAANVPVMINKAGQSLADKFDLVLTFDYENLNTPIEKTAEDLKEKLKLAGIHADGGKSITILAHSMGGAGLSLPDREPGWPRLRGSFGYGGHA